MTETLPLVLRYVRADRLYKTLALMLAGSLFVALLARLSLPLSPVPITGQTLGVLLAGALLGPRIGAGALGLYLVEGALGLPVFAKGGGLGYLRGPTGGSLFAFPLAAYLAGLAVEAGLTKRLPLAFLAFALAGLSVYLVGLPWLAVYLGADFSRALGLVFYPFVPGDLVKALLAAIIAHRLYRR